MLEFIDKILMVFRPCFSRDAAFGWFVTIVIGIMVRSDSLGATSIIRNLALGSGGCRLCQVVSEAGRDRVIRTLRAIEGYVMLSSIAMGTIQMLCLEYEGKIRVSDYRYLRTPSRPVMSEASMMCYLRRNLFRFMARKGSLTITKIITSKQIPPEIEDLDLFIS